MKLSQRCDGQKNGIRSEPAKILLFLRPLFLRLAVAIFFQLYLHCRQLISIKNCLWENRDGAIEQRSAGFMEQLPIVKCATNYNHYPLRH